MGLLDKLFKKKKKEPQISAWEVEQKRLLEILKSTAGTPEYEGVYNEYILHCVEGIITQYERAAYYVTVSWPRSLGDYEHTLKRTKKMCEEYTDMENVANTSNSFSRKMVIFTRSGIMEGIRRASYIIEGIHILNAVPGNFQTDYKEAVRNYLANPRKDIHAQELAMGKEEYPPFSEELLDRFNFVADHIHNMAMLNNPNVVDNNYFLLKEDGTRFEIDYIGSGKPLSETVDATFPLG